MFVEDTDSLAASDNASTTIGRETLQYLKYEDKSLHSLNIYQMQNAIQMQKALHLLYAYFNLV